MRSLQDRSFPLILRKGLRKPVLLGLKSRGPTLGDLSWILKEHGLEKLLLRRGQHELSPRGRRALVGTRHALDLLLLQIFELRLPVELQSCFCFPAEKILLEED